MGKSLLLNRIIDYANKQDYRTVRFDLNQADNSVLRDYSIFLQWICACISEDLGIVDRTDSCWNRKKGLNTNCTNYFQDYILSNFTKPLVLALDNTERLFGIENIVNDFFPLLRSWHEEAKLRTQKGQIWKNFRLILVYSTNNYPQLDINHSPFNVGEVTKLPELNKLQVIELAKRHDIDQYIGKDEICILMELVDGHPYLIDIAFDYLKSPLNSFETFIKYAATEAGIYNSHLRVLYYILRKNLELEKAFKDVLVSSKPIALEPSICFKLQSLGLVKLEGNGCFVSRHLYTRYFLEQLKIGV